MQTITTNKQDIIVALYEWVARRPGLEWGNYCDSKLYRAEMRRITKQRHDAEALIRYVSLSDSITGEMLAEALDGRNRLALKSDGNGGQRLDYCTGQYWCVEYRAAVCRVLSSILWRWFREQCGCDTREKIQATAVRNFGRPIAKRWFN